MYYEKLLLKVRELQEECRKINKELIDMRIEYSSFYIEYSGVKIFAKQETLLKMENELKNENKYNYRDFLT